MIDQARFVKYLYGHADPMMRVVVLKPEVVEQVFEQVIADLFAFGDERHSTWATVGEQYFAIGGSLSTIKVVGVNSRESARTHLAHFMRFARHPRYSNLLRDAYRLIPYVPPARVPAGYLNVAEASVKTTFCRRHIYWLARGARVKTIKQNYRLLIDAASLAEYVKAPCKNRGQGHKRGYWSE